MDNFETEEEDFFLVSEEASLPPQRTLKRLRKGTFVPNKSSQLDPVSTEASGKDNRLRVPGEELKASPGAQSQSAGNGGTGNCGDESQAETKRKSPEELLKSFSMELEDVVRGLSDGDISKKRKIVQKSLLTMVLLNNSKERKATLTNDESTIAHFADDKDVNEAAEETLPETEDGDPKSSVGVLKSLGKMDESEEDLTGNGGCEDDEEEENSASENESIVDEEELEEDDEEVDEDDEEAILNLLAKERSRSKENNTAISSADATVVETPSQNTEGKESAGQDRGRRKKEKKSELEEIHAQSQRLLRESKGVSFKANQTTVKSISSVLEKIRSRKLQLAHGLEKRPVPGLGDLKPSVPIKGLSKIMSNEAEFSIDLTNEDEFDVVLEADVPVKLEALVKEQLGEAFHQLADKKSQEGGQEGLLRELHEVNGNVPSTPENLAEPCRSDLNSKNSLFRNGNLFRAPLEDTQDLFCPSQLSQDEEPEGSSLPTAQEHEAIGSGLQVKLHLDTQTQDEEYDSWLDFDSNKENLDPSIRQWSEPAGPASVASVRALIDEEAEDEDEDLLGYNDEDGVDEGEDLKDLVASVQEKAGDAERRTELHRKWLEQQDDAMTDDILLRLKTGWVPRELRNRGLDFLEEDDQIDKGDEIISDHVDGTKPAPMTHEDAEQEISQDSKDGKHEDISCQEEIILPRIEPEIDDLLEPSDDEEMEQKILRQRFLEESEEQEEFMSPEDDDTSREVFGLIQKVNVVVNKKKSNLGSIENRGSGSSNNSNSSWGSKSSFLRKTGGSSLQLALKQGPINSGTRSFIFGRDDSNSGSGLVHGEDHGEDAKENGQPSQETKRGTSNKMVGSMSQMNTSSKTRKFSATGPSLFDILKRQATHLGESLQSKNPNTMNDNQTTEGASIFAAFRPFKPTRPTRTTRGA